MGAGGGGGRWGWGKEEEGEGNECFKVVAFKMFFEGKREGVGVGGWGV